MSNVHFAIEFGKKGCRLLDLNSTNGTFLNGARTKDATLADGDEIRAGSTIFVFRVLREQDRRSAPSAEPSFEAVPEEFLETQRDQSAPTLLKPGQLPSLPAADRAHAAVLDASQPATPQARLLDLLRKDLQPLYALLDASREPSVYKVIYESMEEYQSLYEGAQGAQLTHFAPYLIRIPQKSALLETLATQAWSKSWGVFLTCDKPLKELRTHFRHFLSVKLPDGRQVYFRYYDPRVLRTFLPTCQPDEINQFFGPVKQFLIEAEDPKLALHFTRGPQGAAQKDLHLVPA